MTDSFQLPPRRVWGARRHTLSIAAIVSGLAILAPAVAASSPGLVPPTSAARVSAKAAIASLAATMDQFHNRLAVYDDVSSAGSHFTTFGLIPGAGAPVTINGSWAQRPHAGATCIQFAYQPSAPFAGVVMLNGVLPAGTVAPLPNMGEVHNAGIDLSGATSLVFWARGERGGERITFYMGGSGYEGGTGDVLPGVEPDSTTSLSRAFTLTNKWKAYSIDVARANLSYVLNGFGWVASSKDNPGGAVFYVDDIQYTLSPAAKRARLELPRFLRSYATHPVQSDPIAGDFDLRFRNAAFTYDNAMAILAFLADGTADNLRRARQIGDAFIYASTHDRALNNGALRSVYAAGDIALPDGWLANGRSGTVASPGFYDEPAGRFVDLWTQGDDLGALDVGNNAWVMIAQLALFRRTLDQRYLSEAALLGTFIEGFLSTAGDYPGYLGGTSSPDFPAATPRTYASTEHNIDAFAAFTSLYNATGDARWKHDADLAASFVAKMWDPVVAAFRAGTLDPHTRNELAGQLPIDVQAWSVLSLPNVLVDHPEILVSATGHQGVTQRKLTGFDFNDDRDGIWPEGTAQMAVAYAFAHETSRARALQASLLTLQRTPGIGDAFGISASVNDALSTGFRFEYFRRLHVGATAWNVLGQLSINPYYE